MTDLVHDGPGRQGPETRSKTQSKVALVCGVLAVLTAVWMYWLVLPGVALGIAAIVLGWRQRRDGGRELGSVALALGIVAVLLVPSVLVMTKWAEDWGRHCALHQSEC